MQMKKKNKHNVERRKTAPAAKVSYYKRSYSSPTPKYGKKWQIHTNFFFYISKDHIFNKKNQGFEVQTWKYREQAQRWAAEDRSGRKSLLE